MRFYVFDLPEPDRPFEQRYRRLQQLVTAADSRYLVLVEQRVVASHDELMARLEQTVAAGGEGGLMLKRRKSLYQAGRSDDLLKVKKHQDAEATVVAHLPARASMRDYWGGHWR